jgi:hypothetical protein
LAEQPGTPGEQREPSQQRQGKAEVREHGAAYARPVERQGPAEDLGMHAADGLEQTQVRAPQALLRSDLDEHRGPGVLDLVHRVAEAGHELLRFPRRPDRG